MGEILKSFSLITKYNHEVIDLYNQLNKSFISILQYNSFVEEKGDLLKQQEILNKIGLLSVSSEIIEKLKNVNNSIDLNKQNLKFLEEDYFKEKKRIDKFKKTIDNYNTKIKNLREHKKEKFLQIENLTKEMDDYPIKNEKKNKNNISYSKRFQELKKQTGNYQFEIRKASERQNTVNLELEKFIGGFEILKSNYQDLLSKLNNDKDKQKKIKKELGKRLNYNLDKFRSSDLLISTEKINKLIQKIENKMISIQKSNEFLNINQPNEILKIKEELKSLQIKVSGNQEISSVLKKAEIIESIVNFNKIENLIKNLERILNNFLLQIYLKLEIETMINQDNNNIIFHLKFFQIRKKTILSFNELTTPEKVFFVIIFYISVNVLFNFKNIKFSNLLLPTIYNKRGSIFRTLKKIIPIFEREDDLRGFNLIFILSNLVMKGQINNLNVITI